MGNTTSQRTGELPAADIASFASELTYDDLPAEAIRTAERCFVDTVGVTLAGAGEGAGEIAATALNGSDGDGPASVLGREMTTSAPEAAFINGTAGHGLDFDDVSDGLNGHPSVTLVAPILAVGEAMGSPGSAALTAFVAGFETECYLTAPVSPDHYEAGWHATATIGTFGAATAAAVLLGLSEDRIAHAINIAASMPAGLKRNFGTMTKPMHAGQAARSGVTAALLAAEGFTADHDAIRGSGGFFELYGGTADPDFDAMVPLGEPWAITQYGVGVKKYPCCYFTHTAITAVSRLMNEHDLSVDDVDTVDVVVSRGAGDALVHEDPETGLEGKFSMEYSVASAIVRDQVDLAAFDDENISDPEVQAVREQVTFDTDPDVSYGSYRSTVTIETIDGDTISKTLDQPEGTHDNPLSDAELREKFMMCADRVFDRDEGERLYRIMDDLRECNDVSDVF